MDLGSSNALLTPYNSYMRFQNMTSFLIYDLKVKVKFKVKHFQKSSILNSSIFLTYKKCLHLANILTQHWHNRLLELCAIVCKMIKNYRPQKTITAAQMGSLYFCPKPEVELQIALALVLFELQRRESDILEAQILVFNVPCCI